MRIEITKDNLLYGVQTVNRAVAAKAPLPILSGIKFQTANNQLILTGTDINIGIACTVPVTTHEEGTVVIPAKTITEIARKLPDGNVELTVEGDAVLIKYGKSKAKINCYPGDDFPQLPTMQDGIAFTLPVKEFKEMLGQVIVATSSDENRPIFTGVLLETKGNELTLVATDTHRLVKSSFQLENPLPETKAIIPGRTISDLERLIGKEENVSLKVGNDQILFALSDTVILSRLIEGKYPDYQQVLPKSHKTMIKVNLKELLDATERASLLTKGGSSQVIKYKIYKGIIPMIGIHANTEIGKIDEEIPLLEFTGEEMEIGYNADYIASALKTMGCDEVTFELGGPLSPGVLRKVGDDDYLHLVLPIRTA